MFKRFWWVFLVMLPAGALVGFLLAAVFTYVMPKKYESQAAIEVRPIAAEKGSLGYDPTDTIGTPSEDVRKTPMYLKKAVEEIKSSNHLVKVIEKLELSNKWVVGKETAVAILKGIVITENIRGTDVICIKVRHTDREDARNIASEVARVYRDYRRELSDRDLERHLAEWNRAVKAQEEKVEEARKVLSEIEIARKKNITVDGTETLLHLPDSQNYIYAKRNFETDQDLLQKLKLKQIGATMEGKIQNESVVIHEEPQIADDPVSPNVTLNLVLGIGLGLLISPLLALPLIFLLNRLNPVKEGRTTADPSWP